MSEAVQTVERTKPVVRDDRKPKKQPPYNVVLLDDDDHTYEYVIQMLGKLFRPGLEKALVFLDERLLGTTSNAVERGNRRYRKMRKTVYRVRTRRAIEGRLALDLQRERQGDGRAETTHTLHKRP